MRYKLSFVLILLVLGWSISSASHAENESKKPPPNNRVISKPEQKKPNTSDKQPTNDERGTEKMPLIIKSIPSEKSTQQAEEDRKERDIKLALDRELTAYTGWQSFLTFILVIVGGGQLILFRWQLRMIRESLSDTRKAADAATAEAAASRDSADIAKLAMIAGNRAYIHYSGCRWVSHERVPDGYIFWKIKASWRNAGNTPTRGLRIYTHLDIRDDELPQDYTFSPDPKINSSLVIIAPGGIAESGGWEIRGTDLAAVARGEKHLYIWGRAVYRDVFPRTHEHTTKFCVFANQITGDPTIHWHEKSNPLEIVFSNYHRHNCADEDCEEGR